MAETTRDRMGNRIAQRVFGFCVLVCVCYLASSAILQGGRATAALVLGPILVVIAGVFLTKRPEMFFILFLLASSNVLGLVPEQAYPVLAFNIGSVSTFDVLLFLPFFWLKAQIQAGMRQRTKTVFDRPLAFVFFLIGMGLLNSVLFMDVPYREAVRMGRLYLGYLFFFILMDAVRDEKTFWSLLKAVAVIVVAGSLVQISEFLIGRPLLDNLGMVSSTADRFGYLTLKLPGRDVFRVLPKTGSFGTVLFFVSLFATLHERDAKKKSLYFLSMVVCLVSVLMGFGRTSYVMLFLGLVAGAVLEKDQRDYFLLLRKFLGFSVLVVILLSFFFIYQGGDFLALLWTRGSGIWRDVFEARDTFGFRLDVLPDSFRVGLRNPLLGVGFGVGAHWDVGFLAFFHHFGLLGLVFYVWIIKTAIARFLQVYRKPLSDRARPVINGLCSYAIAQLIVLPIQDPFPVPIGILLVVLSLFIVEGIDRFDRPPRAGGDTPDPAHPPTQGSRTRPALKFTPR